jgi:hypothetical protein
MELEVSEGIGTKRRTTGAGVPTGHLVISILRNLVVSYRADTAYHDLIAGPLLCKPRQLRETCAPAYDQEPCP